MIARTRAATSKFIYGIVESHTTGPILLAVAVGVGAGFGAVVFRVLIASAGRVFFGGLGDVLGFLGRYYVILVPAAGGLLVGPLIYHLPRECILVSIRRAGRVLIPHGSTVLEPGDKVLALAKRSDERELLKAFGQ